MPVPAPLSSVLNEALASGRNLKDVTVLAAQNDPFRQDTPASRRDGEWLAMIVEQANLGDRTIHLRGLHYVAVSLEAVKPNGNPYTNTEKDWLWLSGSAAKSARFLRYVEFDRIFDNRNSEPVVRLHKPERVTPFLNVGLDIDIPDVDDLVPTIGIRGFTGIQPYRLVLIGEKGSLLDVLGPVAEARRADLYLPTGEISDSLIYRIAADTDTDGRQLVVLYFADCDPSGWQMGISVARKLQAFQAGWFPKISFEVHRVALTPDQVRAYGLPSTPLKDTERRADRWQAATGLAQTEIDALAALQPDLLRRIALDAIAPFYDTSLERRVSEARRDWLNQAQTVVDASLDHDALAAIRADAALKLGEMRDQITEINEALQVDVNEDDLPEPVIPEPIIDEDAHPLPLISSGWDWVYQTERLKASKAYEDDD
jgi:hypothetical protein